jgi:hypothetical protein
MSSVILLICIVVIHRGGKVVERFVLGKGMRRDNSEQITDNWRRRAVRKTFGTGKRRPPQKAAATNARHVSVIGKK